MNWMLQRLAAAVITGIGFKLGGDLYETVKTRLTDRKNENEESVENIAAEPVSSDDPDVGEK